jgi:PPOX class probable F420-dependent enzyme
MTIPHLNMSQTEIEEFLRPPRFAIVGTNRKDGPPQLTPVWYLYEKQKLYVSMFTKSAKYKNLRRDPRLSICIAGDNPDARAVIFSGSAELYLQDSELWVNDIMWRLIRRYYDSDEEAKSYQNTESNSGESALTVLSPDRILAQDYN